ncbi:MAG: glycosyltransferase, partial [Candidatus Sumerlaeota bacterium]|nr:glycosyltransferase [Candidatus Sumerlaeota bacterium]
GGARLLYGEAAQWWQKASFSAAWGAAGLALMAAAYPAMRWLRSRSYARYRKRLRQAPQAPGPVIQALYNLLLQRDFHRTALREVREGGAPDLIYARNAWFAWPIARLARRLRRPLILEVNAITWMEKEIHREQAFARLCKRIERRNLEQANLVLPVSELVREQALRAGARPEATFTTPNGVDVEAFEAALAAPRLAMTTGRFVAGLVCSFKPYHAAELLVEAAERLRREIPNLLVWLIGDGPEFARVARTVQEKGLGDVVRLEGTAPHEMLPLYVAQFDVACAPFQGERNRYMSPIKVYEYMAARKAIVCPAWGQLGDLLTDRETALFHLEGDADDLAARILELHRHPELAERIAANAAALTRGRTWLDILRGVLARLPERGVLVDELRGEETEDPEAARRRRGTRRAAEKILLDRRAAMDALAVAMNRNWLWDEYERERRAFLGRVSAEAILLERREDEEALDASDESVFAEEEPAASVEDESTQSALSTSSTPSNESEAPADSEEASESAEAPAFPASGNGEADGGQEEEPQFESREDLPTIPELYVATPEPASRIARGPLDQRLFDLRAKWLSWVAEGKERRVRRRGWPADRPLHVMRLASSASVGGPAKVMNQTLLRLDPSRVRTTVLLFGKKGHISPRLLNAPGLSYRHHEMMLWLPSWDWNVFSNIKALRRILEQEKVDLAHLDEPQFAPAVRIAAAQAGIPLIIQLHSAYSTRRKTCPAIHKRLERKAMAALPLVGHAQNVVDDAYKYIGMGLTAHVKPINLVEDGMDDAPMWGQDEKLESWILRRASGRKMVIMIARLIALKRIPDFMN